MSTQDYKQLQPGESIKPVLNTNEAIKLIKQYFGLDVVKIRQLNSYDDINYLVDVQKEDRETTDRYVFKILNSMDSTRPHYIDAQIEAAIVLHRNGIVCPQHVPTVTDNKFYALVTFPPQPDAEDNVASNEMGKVHLIRLLTFISGKILPEANLDSRLLFQAGKYIAKWQKYLKSFTHKGLEGHDSIWFLTSTPRLRQFLYVLDDHLERKNLVLSILHAYENHVAPIAPSLEKGVSHGDFNESNIICREIPSNPSKFDVYGVIDFGDMNYGNYIDDLATSMCYMMIEGEKRGLDPVVSSAHVLAGYSSVRPVPPTEIKMLRTLISARMGISLTMGAYTYTLDPGNTYLLTTAEKGWPLLNKIWVDTTDEEIQKVWSDIAEEYPSNH